MAPFVREVRGIPLWLMREYLVDAGGRAADEAVEPLAAGLAVVLVDRHRP